jgi:hypothetical protein
MFFADRVANQLVRAPWQNMTTAEQRDQASTLFQRKISDKRISIAHLKPAVRTEIEAVDLNGAHTLAMTPELSREMSAAIMEVV